MYDFFFNELVGSMLSDVFKLKGFDTFFSILLGLFVATLFRPMCKGGDCFGFKTPAYETVSGKYFKIKDQCYQFHQKTIDCPGDTSDLIEPFTWEQVRQLDAINAS
jgi:hypothetical protein